MQLWQEHVVYFSLIRLSFLIKFLRVSNFLGLIVALHLSQDAFIVMHLLSGLAFNFFCVGGAHVQLPSKLILSLYALQMVSTEESPLVGAFSLYN